MAKVLNKRMLIGGNPPVTVQYRRSFEQLETYAKDRNCHHYPAWKAFNLKMKGNSDVGIWHETYKVKAGEYECVYNNMPKFGLGKTGEVIPATGKRETAEGRMEKTQ